MPPMVQISDISDGVYPHLHPRSPGDHVWEIIMRLEREGTSSTAHNLMVDASSF